MERIVGVDISKARLDAFCLASGRRLAVGNDAAGVAELAAWLQPGSLVVMEASGGYERLVHRLLVERGSKAAVVNAFRVRQFAKASGLLAKTDRLDAAVIARYGARIDKDIGRALQALRTLRNFPDAWIDEWRHGTSAPCLEPVWHGVGAATPCRGWLRGVGDRCEPRV